MSEQRSWEDYGLTPKDAAPPLDGVEYIPQPQYHYTILDIAREELRERYNTAFSDGGSPALAFAQWLNSKHPIRRANISAFTGAPTDARLSISEFVRGADFTFTLDLTTNTARPVSFFCGAVHDLYNYELVIPLNMTYAREDDNDPGVLLLDRGFGADEMASEAIDVLGTLLLVQWAMRLEGKWPWGACAVEQMMMRSY